MTGSPAVTGWMASLAFRVLLATASKALQETLVTRELLEPRASQERWGPQDWACRAPRANRVSLEMQGSQVPRAFQVLLAPQAAQEIQIATQV